jgi:hypothetical protein
MAAYGSVPLLFLHSPHLIVVHECIVYIGPMIICSNHYMGAVAGFFFMLLVFLVMLIVLVIRKNSKFLDYHVRLVTITIKIFKMRESVQPIHSLASWLYIKRGPYPS